MVTCVVHGSLISVMLFPLVHGCFGCFLGPAASPATSLAALKSTPFVHAVLTGLTAGLHLLSHQKKRPARDAFSHSCLVYTDGKKYYTMWNHIATGRH